MLSEEPVHQYSHAVRVGRSGDPAGPGVESSFITSPSTRVVKGAETQISGLA